MPPKRADIPIVTLVIQGETLTKQLTSLTLMVESIDINLPTARRKARALNNDVHSALNDTATLLENMSYSNEFSTIKDLHSQLIDLKLNLSIKYQELVDDEPTSQSGSSLNEASSEADDQVKQLQLLQFLLPNIEPFNGDIMKFESFRTQYETAVHNLALPPHIKMSALRKLVTGFARPLLEFYGTSQEDYENAYKELVDKYTGKRRVADAVLNSFHSVPTCSISPKLAEIEKFRDEISASYQSLKNLKIEDLAEFMLFTSAKSRLSYKLQDKLHENVGDTDIPTMKKFTDFLEGEISKMRSREGSQNLTPNPSRSRSPAEDHWKNRRMTTRYSSHPVSYHPSSHVYH
ncbi:hypothetical protein GE061_017900 [Apolygus lucorum]|uniref:Uncharacterized protein n=1 Tax=Apolygus lucorum TaxID=248454 RepID=A0A8S9XDQ7_APOLU|nr:hypothetical protein GE061_017900 [Apolygus lucorum]